MAKNEQQRIEKIQCGRIDFYIPLIFQNKNFENICIKINKGLDKYIARHCSAIQLDTQDFMADQEDKDEKKSIVQRVKRFICDRRKNQRRAIYRENMNNIIKVGVTDKEIKIKLTLEEMETFQDKRDELIDMYDKYKEIYGLEFTNSQVIYVLLPLHIQLNNGEYVWLNAILFVFQNKMGILKLELPLSNVSSQPLMENDYNAYIKKIEIPWLIDMQIQKNTIECICEAYKKKFIEDVGISVRGVGGMFRNVILSQFDGMPKQINNISNGVMVDLYRIIAAPVTMMDCTSYERDAREYIKEHQWVKHNSKYICSTTGACLSITDVAFREYFLERYKQIYGIDVFEEQEKKIIYERVVNNLCLNAEYAIIILVLKYLNAKYFYELLLKNPQAMNDAKKKYNINIMFISEWQEECFGTVTEQIETFERVMPYYLKENITAEKLRAIDDILATEEAKRQESLQNVIGFGGLAMAALFGFPAIYETISIMRDMCTFITIDIPIFTIKNISALVWVIVMFILGFALYRGKSRRQKKIYSTL